MTTGARRPRGRLAEQFGVSRNTLREAVRTLSREGLVMQGRNKTATVVELTVEDAADLYSVRRLLELSAIDRLKAATDAGLQGVDAACNHLEAVAVAAIASPSDDWVPIIVADLDFHRSIVALHGSPRLVRAFESIRYELSFCVALLTADERRAGMTDRMTGEHDEIRRAILARDKAEARRLVSAHLDRYESETRGFLGTT
jgi:DNA-binding GntR family transcriptional regulator